MKADPGRTGEQEADPFLAALATAEYDDEPFTEEQRAAAQAGWAEFERGETVPLEVVLRELLESDEPESS